MPMKVLEATLATFDGVFQQFTNEAANNKANFILFYADKEPSTNLSWCPGERKILAVKFLFRDYDISILEGTILCCLGLDDKSLESLTRKVTVLSLYLGSECFVPI
ncbi:uncharacterized protein LOC121754115 isoform X2 [Salvia splendens]|uniref:uncharacterized protein LOC121754115 isoform X2 n=1 Tax=Salvia splendens TaxID=180675 RepID=UPI001C267F87|nr:uncharacterized protein LOC121754115 isoform X2 [Salvia splendens]